MRREEKNDGRLSQRGKESDNDLEDCGLRNPSPLSPLYREISVLSFLSRSVSFCLVLLAPRERGIFCI
jgi:hypothetical protein